MHNLSGTLLPSSPLGMPHGQMRLHVPAGRRSCDGSQLDSLALPVAQPHGAHRSLMEELWERGLKTGKDQQTVLDAGTAIARLNAWDQWLEKSSEASDLAIHLLLELGQHKLLLRLAQIRGGVDFVLRIADSAQMAETLEQIGTEWPPNASVSLMLSPALAADAVQRLETFVQCPLHLSVYIDGKGSMQADAAKAWGRLLHQRPIHIFGLGEGPFPCEFFEALPGAKARTLEWCMQSVEPSAVAPMEAFVKGSGATRLGLTMSKLDGPTCAALIASREAWDGVGTRAFPEVLDLILQGRIKIREGTLQPAAQLLPVTHLLLEALHACGMRKLTVNGALDLVQWWTAVQQFAKAHPYVVLLDSLEACFVAPQGANTMAAFAALAADTSVSDFKPCVMPLAIQGYEWLDGPATELLRGLARLKGALYLMQTVQGVAAQFDLRCKQESQVAAWLRDDCTDGMVCSGLEQSTSFWRLNPSDPPPQGNNTSLLLKLNRFARAIPPVSADIVGSAVAQHLRQDPAFTARDACRAFIASGRYTRQREPHEWRALGFRIRETWLGGDPSLTEEGTPVQAVASRGVGARPSSYRQPLTLDLLDLTRWGSREALVQRYRDKAAAYHNAGEDRSRVLANGVGHWIEAGLGQWNMGFALVQETPRELLEEGQGRLFRHLVPDLPSWQVTVASATAAAAFAGMADWPASGHELVLQLSPELGENDVGNVLAYASRVEPGLLTLQIELRDGIPPSYWAAMAAFVRARPQMRLQLAAVPGTPLPEADLQAFFQRLETLQLHSLDLHAVGPMNESVLVALVGAIKGARVQALRLSDCFGDWIHPLLSCQPWHELHIPASPGMASVCSTGGVVVRTLKLADPDDSRPLSGTAELIIGSCKQTERLEVEGTINALALARGLYASGTIHSVTCLNWQTLPTQDLETEKWFGRNQVLLSFRLLTTSGIMDGNMSRLRSPLERTIDQVVRRNAFRLSGEFLRRVGRELFGDSLNPDIGQLIGSQLDPASALAASSTTKAAYLQSREVWHREIELLARALMPGGNLRPRMEALHQAGALPTVASEASAFATGSILKKADQLARSDPHNTVIAVALARALHHLLNMPTATLPENAVRDCLEAMAYVGGIAPAWWLREGIGINVADGRK